MKDLDFTRGKIVGPLLRFAFPVFCALFLQSMYGAVDLLIVGHFGTNADVSAVSTGSQIMQTLTNLVGCFATGVTVVLGQMIGSGRTHECGKLTGCGICFFGSIALVLTVLVPVFSPSLASLMNAPEEAFDLTCSYIRICGLGSLVIVFYNLIGSIFRGIGDSTTPLITVTIACVFNILGDLLLVAGFHMGTAGAAIATVLAQAISVVLSIILIRKKGLPFEFHLKDLSLSKNHLRSIVKIGAPISLQELLVGISFLVILALVNDIGLVESAGIGVAEKVCAFIMLVPSAFSQSMAAFVAQNIGAGQFGRAKKALWSAIGISECGGVLMFVLAFFFGVPLASIFTKDLEAAQAAADYLKAYGIDCLLTCFLFCFIGFFSGVGYTKFVMVQGIVSAFGVRVPVSFMASRETPVSLFHIGLATPASTILQIILCFICYYFVSKKYTRVQEFKSK